MVLSDQDIRKSIDQGLIKIAPVPDFDSQLGSCSLDLRLGTKFRVFNHNMTPFIDPYDSKSLEGLMSEIEVARDATFTLHPGELVLAMTVEHITLPDNIIGTLEGRSSIGRLGVVVHSTANTIDAGFRGNIVLELANMGKIPVLLHPDMRICAVSFHQLSTPAQIPYYRKLTAKYSDQNSPVASKISQDE